MLALSTYATLSDIIAGMLGNNILVTTCVFITGFMIFAMCEGANDVVHKVSVGTFGRPENPQYAFLRRGSKIICPMSQLCGM